MARDFRFEPPQASSTALTAAVAAITDNSGGTASDTIADIEATYTEATLANAFATVAAKIDNLRTRVNELEAALEKASILES